MQREWFVFLDRNVNEVTIVFCIGAVRTSPMIVKMLSTEATTTEEKRRKTNIKCLTWH